MIKFCIITFCFLFIGFSYPNSTYKNENINVNIVEKVELKINETNNSYQQDNRLVLDSLLNNKYNNFLASMENGYMTICCYHNLLDNPLPFLTEDSLLSEYKFLELYKEYYEFDGKIHEVKVYRYGDSYFKTHYHEYQGRFYTNLVCGKIESEKFIFRNGIQIGMNRSKFLELIFEPSELFNKIDTLTISKNELGEAETYYIFSEDKLTEIIFESIYDWIDRDLKK